MNLGRNALSARSVALAVFFSLALTSFSPTSRASAAEPSEVAGGVAEFDLRVGIVGAHKSGTQTPVFWTWDPLSFEAVAVELETDDCDGTPFFARREIPESERQTGRFETRFIFPKASAKLTARMFDATGARIERSFFPSNKVAKSDRDEGAPKLALSRPVVSSKPVFLVLGSSESFNDAFNEAYAELRWKEERRPLVVHATSIDDLPSDFRSYEVADKIFISTSNPGFFDGIDANDPRIQALARWTERGGSIVLFADERAIPLLKEGGALAPFSPGETIADAPQEFRSVTSLITELRNVKNLSMTGSKSAPYLRTPVISDLKRGAKVEIREVETPLLVACPRGLGEIVYFAGDPSRAPFANWSDRGQLILKILGIDPDRATAKTSASSYVKQGYVDISGQIRSALDSFEGAKTVPFFTVAGLIFAYLLCVSLVDRLLSKTLIKQPNVTWLLFPFFAILFCAIAVVGLRGSTPKSPVLNQVDAIDVDFETGIIRDSTWAGFYSPTSERYDLSFSPGRFAIEGATESTSVADESIDFSPLTLAGDGIGGAEQKSLAPRAWLEGYELSRSDGVATLKSTPMTARSSKSFFGRWSGRLSNLPAAPELFDDGLSLSGTILNPFDAPIYSAFVVYDGGAYYLGTLAPGENQIESGLTRLEPRRVFNERLSSLPDAKRNGRFDWAYNVASRRLPYALRTASFYEFGGGEDNFGISARCQRDVDLSQLLRCGRAAIFGTIVDARFQEYSETGEFASKSVNARQDERLRRKLAEERGEVFENGRENPVEKYGSTGSSDSFVPTSLSFCRADGSEETSASERTVVVRLIVPLERGVKN